MKSIIGVEFNNPDIINKIKPSTIKAQSPGEYADTIIKIIRELEKGL